MSASEKKEESTVLRVAERAQIFHRGELVYESGERSPCLILDISQTGMKIDCSKEDKCPKPKSRCRVEWKYLESAPLMEVEAVCVWNREEHAGLHFENLNSKAQHLIQGLVKSHRQNKGQAKPRPAFMKKAG